LVDEEGTGVCEGKVRGNNWHFVSLREVSVKLRRLVEEESLTVFAFFLSIVLVFSLIYYYGEHSLLH